MHRAARLPIYSIHTLPVTANNNSGSAATAVAYFSMEICLEEAIPTYSGGLGVLAGDTVRSAADLHVPMVAVTLVHRKGYFRQILDQSGEQTEGPLPWTPEDRLKLMAAEVSVEIAGRRVRVRAWEYPVVGVTGHTVPVYLLDTDVEGNDEWDRTLTDYLYGGDQYYRLCQEVVLGAGGSALLFALGYRGDVTYHINEGHAALLTLTKLQRQLAGRARWDVREGDIEAVRRQCVFTTHTPVPAGHDRFPLDTVRGVLGDENVALLESAGGVESDELNMTQLARRFSRYVNGVALRHRDVSRDMFGDNSVNSITNGVHATTWTAPAFSELFDELIPEWRLDNLYLRHAINIPLPRIREAHAAAKADLLSEIEGRFGHELDPAALTIGFARRATPYKRADLIFSDIERLREATRAAGPLQIVYGGKAHPHDGGGKELIRRIHDAARELEGDIRVIYLENYDMALAKKFIAGVDVWLNNPMKPLEASGTSGMKAALNGVPSFSVLDGWWVEGHAEGITGWSIGTGHEEPSDPVQEVQDIYHKLEHIIGPLYYGLPNAWAEVMRYSISMNGSFFNTQRMVAQYVQNAYFPHARQLAPSAVSAAR